MMSSNPLIEPGQSVAGEVWQSAYATRANFS
jgi:hypothetical protein